MSLKKIIKKIPGSIAVYDFVFGIIKKVNNYINFIVCAFDFFKFKKLSVEKRFKLIFHTKSAITTEKTIQTEFDRHYVYHTAWAARCLFETKPTKHVDISSSLFFSAICSTFSKIEFYDFRPANIKLENLTSHASDLTNLKFENNSISSLSCMHTVEHIGLGRYGDPIDPNGDLIAIKELERVLAPQGNLFFVVPIGNKAIVKFNSHRVYTAEQILSYFSNLKLIEFVLIPENSKDGGLVKNPSEELLNRQKYACGCFWFKKH